MYPYKRMLLALPVLSIVYLNQPTQAYAWFFGFGEEHRDRDRGYAQVVVGDGRYYYNDGVFYTGAPGSYVVVEAPVGAVVYDAPPGFQQVVIDGEVYFVDHDVYYRHEGRGYRVVERPHRHDHDRDERRDEHHGE